MCTVDRLPKCDGLIRNWTIGFYCTAEFGNHCRECLSNPSWQQAYGVPCQLDSDPAKEGSFPAVHRSDQRSLVMNSSASCLRTKQVEPKVAELFECFIVRHTVPLHDSFG
jgi:hypothetical protein